jgi:hypothetical protein
MLRPQCGPGEGRIALRMGATFMKLGRAPATRSMTCASLKAWSC